MVIGVTGATGFLGGHVLNQIARMGHEAVAYSRLPQAALSGARETRVWSVAEPPDFSGCQAIIHLAGESIFGLWTRAKRRAILDSRVLGTRAVVAALAQQRAGAATLVCASAIGFYGDRGDEALDESSPAGTGFLAEVTQQWEAEAQTANTLGVRVVCGRLGLVLGPGGGAWPLLRRLFRLGAGGRLGSGRQWMSWVHVRDVAALMVQAVVDERLHGPMNIVSPTPVTNREFTRSVGKALGRPAFIPVPATALRLLLRDQASLLLASQRVLPKVATDMGSSFACPSLDMALENLKT